MIFTTRGKIYLLLTTVSILFSYLITTLDYFPYFGFSLLLTIFTLLSYKFIKNKSSDTHVYFFITLVFSFFLVVRSEGFLTFVNLICSIFFGTLMLASGNRKSNGFLDYLFTPVSVIVKSVFTKSIYYPEFLNSRKSTNGSKKTGTFLSIILTFLLIAVITPLLSSANPIFAKITENILSLFNISEWLNNLKDEDIFIFALRVLFFAGFVFIIPKILTLVGIKNNFEFPVKIKTDIISYTIPETAISILLFIFFVTQIGYYFADTATLSSLGISYSKHAREVFGQLTIVSAIVFLLIYNDRGKTNSSGKLTMLLGIESLFLTLISYKSAIDYIKAWGLTYMRLYGLTFATWILGIFVLFFALRYKKDVGNIYLVRNILFYTAIILIAVNVLNFDYLIYHKNKATTGQGTDYTYLSYLSADSSSYKDQYNKLSEELKKSSFPFTDYDNRNPHLILVKIEELKNKYEYLDIRTFNLMDYREYLQVKDLDTITLRDKLLQI